jgi:hypothetical protein
MLTALQSLYRLPTRVCRGLKSSTLERFQHDADLITALQRAKVNYDALNPR